VNILGKYLHKDFRQITYPRSLGRPEQNKEEFLKSFGHIISLWTDTDLTIHSLYDVPGTVIYHFTNKAKSSFGLDSTYEAICILQVVTDDDGSLKIKQMEEFADSKVLNDLLKAYGVA